MRDFYYPGFNSFEAPIVFGVSLSLIIFLSLVVVSFFFHFARTKKPFLFAIGLMLFVILSIQTIVQYSYFLTFIESFPGKSFLERKKAIFKAAYNSPGIPFEFVTCIHKTLKGQRYSGELRSDIGSQEILTSVFYYELYPVIDLISHNPHSDVSVCFSSQECDLNRERSTLICPNQYGYVDLRNKGQ